MINTDPAYLGENLTDLAIPGATERFNMVDNEQITDGGGQEQGQSTEPMTGSEVVASGLRTLSHQAI